MAIIIDDIYHPPLNNSLNNHIEIDGKKYIEKPTDHYNSIFTRFKDIWRLLRGKGMVVYFKEDE